MLHSCLHKKHHKLLKFQDKNDLNYIFNLLKIQQIEVMLYLRFQKINFKSFLYYYHYALFLLVYLIKTNLNIFQV